jgi:alpha-beta hydrolase superfamily lysophospholipase
MEGRHFSTHDGVTLFYRRWPVASGAPRGAILLFHRGHEHGGAWSTSSTSSTRRSSCVDARGHGRSPGAARPLPSFAASVREAVLRRPSRRSRRRPGEDGVIAQSVGAVLISTWRNDYAPKVRASSSPSPAFEVRFGSLARPGLRLLQKAKATACSPTQVELLTRSGIERLGPST